MKHQALVAFFALCSLAGCANTPPPSVPSTAKVLPINKVSPVATAQRKPVDVTQSAPIAMSPTEVPIFRGLDPDVFELMLQQR